MDQSTGFYFVCEITAQIKKAVQYTTHSPDLNVAIDPTVKEQIIVDRVVHLTDQYPFTYKELCERIQKERPKAKSTEINRIISRHKMKSNSSFSAYSFRTKKQKEVYEKTGNLPKAITSIYNDNAIRFILAQLPPIKVDSNY